MQHEMEGRRMRKSSLLNKRNGSPKKRKSPSQKRHSKAVSSGSCSPQYTKKYMSRGSPPYPANKCCGQTRVGNDGEIYHSSMNINRICSWKRA